MRELWIANINSADARSLADNWDSYLRNVGCEIYIQAVYDRMIIAWDSSAPSTIHHILDFVDDTFGDVFNLSKLNRTIKSLKDDHAVIFDSDSGDVEVRVL
jgi:hypothetical protein